MYKGYKFSEDGHTFEVIAMDGDDCVIRKSSGEVFTLKKETLEYLKFVKSMVESDIWD